ncbi:MAG: SDR family oxidoreductase [Oligoflexus sp.]
MSRFENKVVLITGSSSGIGEALARVFHNEGAKLVLLARRLERLQKLQIELDPDKKASIVLPCDVTKHADLQQAIFEARSHFGTIDIVIANAGYTVTGSFHQLGIEDYQRQFEVNVFGVLHTIKEALPSLIESSGQIVIMGSVSSFLSIPTISAYTMSKFAIRALAESLYLELWGYGITTTLICPGFIDTEIHKIDKFGQYQPAFKSKVPERFHISALDAARIMIRGIDRRKKYVLITGHAKFLVFMGRYFSCLFDWISRLALRLQTRISRKDKECFK